MSEDLKNINDLEEAKIIIDNLSKEMKGLNAAFKSLTTSHNISETFENLLKTLQEILHYENAFILFEIQPGQYMSYYATHYDFLERIWMSGDLFKSVESGKPQIVKNITYASEWHQHIDLQKHVKSALHFPLKGSKHNAMFVCTNSKEDFFNHSHFKITSHFIHFAAYAIKMLESNQSLKDEIIEREKVQAENARLQAKVIENAYKEGFAENAISVLHNIGNLVTPLKLKLEGSDQLLEAKKLQVIIDKLAELDDKDKRKLIAQKVNTILKETQEKVEDLINYGNKQVAKISVTITSQQKYANLKNKLKTKVRINEILKDVINTHKGQLEKYKIQLLLQLNNEIDVIIERNGIHHVLTNLMTNAIEAINERSKHFGDFKEKIIYLSLYQTKDHECAFVIKDTGIGITDKEKEKLFTFGFTTKDDGSGFGLHNSSNFIRANGGRIEYSSDGRNQGSTCSIFIPLTPKESH